MSTFLQLCQNVAKDCGVPGSISSVVNQTGEFGDVVRWVNAAWRDVQNEKLWNWLLQDFTFNTVANTMAYSTVTAGATDSNGATDLRTWKTNTFKCYLTSAGVAQEWELPEMDYLLFRRTYMLGTRPTGVPQCFAIRPEDNALLIGPTPSGIYTVYGQYWRTAYDMAANSDTPTGMPAQFHELIEYRARQKYAEFEEAGTVDAAGDRNYRRLRQQHLIQCLPSMLEDWEPMA